MKTITIKDGIMSMANVDFNCPECGQLYSDHNDKYLSRCNKNQSGTTKIRCSCGEWFGMTYDIQGDAVGFSLDKSD